MRVVKAARLLTGMKYRKRNSLTCDGCRLFLAESISAPAA
jgi:hypothetical protein